MKKEYLISRVQNTSRYSVKTFWRTRGWTSKIIQAYHFGTFEAAEKAIELMPEKCHYSIETVYSR
jgi:hypothetical protein